jgi:hypothetical protein
MGFAAAVRAAEKLPRQILNTLHWASRVIYICPDGDVRTNFAVWQGVQRMAGVIRLWDKDGTTQIKMLLLPLNPAGKPPGIDDWLHASPSATEETLLGLTVNIGDTAPPEGYRTYESVKVEIEEIFAVLSERNTILGSRIMEEIKPATWGKARTARTR